MFFLSQMCWPCLLASLAIGAVIGALTWSRLRNGKDEWRTWAALFLFGAVIAALHILPGRTGMWLETALLFLATYLVGCMLGGWLRGVLGDFTGRTAAAFHSIAPDRLHEPAGVADQAALGQQVEGAPEAASLPLEVETHATPAPDEPMEQAKSAVTDIVDSRERADSKPTTSEVVEATEHVSADPGARPPAVSLGAGERGDNLTWIRGVGPKTKEILNDLGVHWFSQIADWNQDIATWVGRHLSFPGRIEREHWIAQAKLLCAGVVTEYAAGVHSGRIQVDAAADAPLPRADAKALGASLPLLAGPVADEAEHGGRRPLGLSGPRDGKPDDLKLIRGIGLQNEARLNDLGVWHFAQIAAWTPEHAQWIGSYLAFPGRIDREKWVEQAMELATGKMTEFAERVVAGLVPTSVDDSSPDHVDVEKPKPLI